LFLLLCMDCETNHRKPPSYLSIIGKLGVAQEIEQSRRNE
jgi:hypothetical protein